MLNSSSAFPTPTATVAAGNTSGASSGHAYGPSSTRKFSLHQFSTYVAEEARVEILSKFSLPKVMCMSGAVGPFTPNYPMVVPLWLALYFRQMEACTLRPPAFLACEYLQGLLERERQSDATFELLHFHFFEVAKLFCQHAQADLPDASDVMRLVPEIQARRREKILKSIAVFQDPVQSLHVPALKVSNLVSTELHFLRTSFCHVLNIVSDMERRGNVVVGGATAATTGSGAASTTSGGNAFVTPQRPSEGTTTIAVTEATSARSDAVPSEVGGAQDDAVTQLEPAAAPMLKKRRTLRQR